MIIKMAKRGQVTTYIILGVIIILIAGTYFYIQSKQIQEQKAIEEKESVAVTAEGIAVTEYIKSCIDMTTKSGTILMGLQGGYTDLPPKYFTTTYSDIPYYYDRGQISVMKTEDIENQLERFVNANMKSCIGNFSTFTEKGVDVVAGSPIANVIINPLTGMSIAVDYDVSVKKENIQESLKMFKSSYNFRIGTVREVAQKIIEKINENPKIAPFSYITELNELYGVQIDSFSYGNDKTVYVINDLQTNVEGDTPLLFLFAVRINPENSLPVIIVDESKLAGSVGQEFNITVDATDEDYDPIEFYTDSASIDIDPLTGEIRFVPEQAGNYNLTLIATDGIGNSTKQITITIQ
jgi:hypothetical protein